MEFVRDLRAVLRKPHFGELYATRLIAQFGDGVFQVGLANFVLFSPERATTASGTAAAFATLLLPYSLVGPFAGVFIDRWPRQRILVVSNVVRAVMVCGVAALVAAGVHDWRFFAAALAVLSVNRFFLSSLSAALPHVVSGDHLVMGNSVSTTSGTVAAVVGGGAGLGVRQVFGTSDAGTAAVVLVATVLYLLSAATARRMARDLLGPDHDPDRPETREALRHVAHGVAQGARHVWEHRHAGDALAAITAHRFFYGISTIATLLLYRNYFTSSRLLPTGIAGLGQVFAASAVGVLLAAFLTPAATRRVGKDVWVVGLFALAALVEIALGAPYQKAPLIGAAFVLGLVAQGSKICVDTIVQETVDDAFRGRVFSFYDILFNVSFVAAAAAAALLLPPSGKSYAVLGLISIGYSVTAAGYLLASRRRAGGALTRPAG